jgi:hypothetical protein
VIFLERTSQWSTWNWRIVFDYCKATEEMSMENWFNFVSEVGNSFLRLPIVEKKKKFILYPEQKNLARNSSWSLCRVQFSAR